MITWYYGLDKHGATVRAPIDLDTLAINWLRAEPWHEPPSKVNDTRDCQRCHQCRCRHKRVTEQGHRA